MPGPDARPGPRSRARRAPRRPPRGRREEDRNGRGHRRPDLPRALALDLEHEGPPGGPPVELRAQRAVAAAGVLGVLDELAARNEPIEVRVAEEVVVDAWL